MPTERIPSYFNKVMTMSVPYVIVENYASHVIHYTMRTISLLSFIV